MEELLGAAAAAAAAEMGDLFQGSMPGLGRLGPGQQPNPLGRLFASGGSSGIGGVSSYLEKLKSGLGDNDDEDDSPKTLSDFLKTTGSRSRSGLGARGVKTEQLNELLQAMTFSIPGLTDENDLTKLMKNIVKEDVQGVKRLIEEGADVNEKAGKKKMTPLMFACMGNSLRIVKLLLENEANVNLTDLDGDTALILAVYRKREDFAELLISYGADVKHKDLKGKNSLHVAAQCGCNNIIPKLIEKGADINGKDLRHWTPLMICCQNNTIGTVELLIKKDADVKAQHVVGGTALEIAAGHGHRLTVKALIKNKAEVNYENNLGITPLIFASLNGHYDVVIKLIKYKADVNHCDKLGRSALFYSCLAGQEDIATYLLSPEVGADPNIGDNEEDTPLMGACQEGKLNIVNCLLKNKADKFLVNNQGMTALTVAVQGSHTQVVRLLLQHEEGDSIPQKFLERPTKLPPLLKASADENNEIIQLLLEAGANASIRDKEGREAMIICAIKGNKKCHGNAGRIWSRR